MNTMIETGLQELNATLDQCFAAWEEAVRTGDLAQVKAYTAEIYNGTVAYVGMDKAEFYDREEAFASLPRLLEHVKNSRQAIERLHVRMRRPEEGIVSFDHVFEREGKVVIRFVLIQAWRKMDGQWLLVRETQEVMGA